MARNATPLSPRPGPARAAGASSDVLQAWARVQAPLCRLLLDAGIDYPRASAELRRIFLQQAHEQMLRSGAADTDSALSLLSGVHRKEVRQWRSQARRADGQAAIPLSSQVYARWSALPGYRDRRRRPKPLPRLGPAPSFESLAREVTQDIHPFSVLQEMARLGLVELSLRKGVEYVVPRHDGYIPHGDLQQLIDLLGMNLADHAAAAVANLGPDTPRLEQSVFADGLSRASMARLAELARELWAQSRDRMVAEALRCLESDRADRAAHGRMRFGAYYWNDPDARAPAPARRRPAAAARGAGQRPSRPSKERL